MLTFVLTSQPPSELSSAARHFGGVYDMWARFSQILHDGQAYEPGTYRNDYDEEYVP